MTFLVLVGVAAVLFVVGVRDAAVLGVLVLVLAIQSAVRKRRGGDA